jgi:spermidine synthase
MVPRILLDTALIPGGGELRLIRRGEEYTIMLGANELMNSRRTGSEVALASLACGALRSRTKPRLLIGGLGFGFTLRAALEQVGAEAELVVAELVPAVVRWARGPIAHLFAGILDDPRVAVLEEDVARPIAAAPAAWDSILLDVDNGPHALTTGANGWLYGREGLAAAREALRPGGVLAIWSADPDPAFCARLRGAGFVVEEHEERSAGRRGARHLIWLAKRR